jgi:hypothetical protein
MPTKLDVFDFDGTLFRSPADTPDNRKKYEAATGLPWLIDKEASRELTKKHKRHIGMRRGWWGRPETLEPPLVPDPAPAEWFNSGVVDAFKASKANPDTLTMVLTGRFTGLKGHVLRILKDGELVTVEATVAKDGQTHYKVTDSDVICHFLGEKGPKPAGTQPSETFPWKVWLIEQYLGLHTDIKTVEFWEDREEHVTNFGALHEVLAETVVVNHVK